MIFRPSLRLTVALLALALLFLRLGLWQLDRQAEKQSLFDRFAAAPRMTIDRALGADQPFARVEAFGRYDPDRHLLLDNKVLNGRPGVHVLTPFQLGDGRWLLVNRGWLPLPADRRSLPAVPTDGSPREIEGLLVRPAAGGPRLGQPDQLDPGSWPQLVTYFDPDDVAAALGVPLEEQILQLDAADPSGFGDRDWQPAIMGPEVHGAYAIQWLALAAATLIIWITLGIRRR